MDVALERHYRARELAKLWGVSANTVIRMFAAEPGVLNLSNFSTPGKRKYTLLSIPESIALAVHSRLRQNPLQASLPPGDPFRVILLGNLNAGVSKKPRNILKLHSRKKSPDRKGIAQPVRSAV